MRFQCDSFEEYNRLRNVFDSGANLEVQIIRLDLKIPEMVGVGQLKLVEETVKRESDW